MLARPSQLLLNRQKGFEALDPGVKMALGRFSMREWRTRINRLDRAVDELGSLFVFPEQADNSSRQIAFDPLPFKLSPDEWNLLHDGVLQRAKAMNAFLRDVYGQRSFLKGGWISPDWILDDPSFALEYANLVRGEYPSMICAVDLVCREDGQWLVSDQQFSTPKGLSHVLQGRRLQAQYFPELFTGTSVEPVVSFPSRLAELLRLGMPHISEEDSIAVMLAGEESNESFPEESFLARQMGVPLVSAQDLVVRDFNVYFRTIHGMIRVPTIYRRIDSEGIDPVSGNRMDLSGVPGLLHCLRAGTVDMVNAPGSGLADNRVFLRSGRQIIRHYLSESAIIKDIPTLVSYDRDQRAEYEEKPDDFWVRPAWKASSACRWQKIHGEERRMIEVAHPKMALRKVHIWNKDHLEPHPFSLRLFCLMGSQPVVLPGGWLRVSNGAPLGDHVGSHWLCSQDVWVQNSEQQRNIPVNVPLESTLDIGENPPGSALAESMYWLGRYLERIDNTARMTSILAEESFASMDDDHRITWDAFMAVVGEESAARLQPYRHDSERFAALMLLNTKQPETVASCIQQARQLADRAMGALSPEFWHVFLQFQQFMQPYAQRKRLAAHECKFVCSGIAGRIAAIFGTADRTLMIDECWRFMVIGSLLERAIITVNLLAKTLPQAARHQKWHQVDDSELVYLLRMTSTLDAYHRIYRSRAFLDRIAHLLWQHSKAPHSVYYCLSESLRHVRLLGDLSPDHPVLQKMTHLIGQVEALPIAELFPARAIYLDWGAPEKPLSMEFSDTGIVEISQVLKGGIENIHMALDSAFLNHEASERREKITAHHAL